MNRLYQLTLKIKSLFKDSQWFYDNLPNVLIQIYLATEEKSKFSAESVEVAKKALNLDLKDGFSWFVLGNALLVNFFTN